MQAKSASANGNDKPQNVHLRSAHSWPPALAGAFSSNDNGKGRQQATANANGQRQNG